MADNESIVRELYRLAEGDVMDAKAFRAGFTEDGVFNGVTDGNSWQGDDVAAAVQSVGEFLPDVHRELRAIHVIGDTVVVELVIEGTHTQPLQTPVGELPATGTRVSFPAADIWRLRDGKVERFDCYNASSLMLAQLGVFPDFAGAIKAAAAV